MDALYLPRAKTHIKFPFLTTFQTISTIPRCCEILLNAVSCYGVEFFATRPNKKLEDTPRRMLAVVYSVYYQLPHTWTLFPPEVPPHPDDMDALSTADKTVQLSLFLS
jgi:hypothetical protein